MSTCLGCKSCYKGVSGSGVLIYTNSKTKSSKYDIILVFDKHKKEYSDLGGGVVTSSHIKQDIVTTAKMEVFEESRKTIMLRRSKISASKFIDIKHGNHFYRCFVIFVPVVSCHAFYNSLKLNLSGSFNETTKMTRFHLNDVVNSGGCKYIVSDKGIICPIFGRTRRVLMTCVAKLSYYFV